jgi:DNA topoisomerase III
MYGRELFKTSGLRVLERNYLDVYPYDKWESSQQLPALSLHETFVPSEAKMTDGETVPPGYLTEPELIALMDANGIGTDATMADHISKIKEREYVQTRPRSGGPSAPTLDSDQDSDEPVPTRGRGGRGRGRGRGRGGSGNGATQGRGRRRVEEFIPTNLGVALIEGYENLRFETSLSKPFLRKETELQMKAICEGRQAKADVLRQNLEQYRAVFERTKEQMDVLKAVGFFVASTYRYLLIGSGCSKVYIESRPILTPHDDTPVAHREADFIYQIRHISPSTVNRMENQSCTAV